MSWPKATDYHEAIQALQFTLGDEELRAGQLALNRRGLPMLWSGNFADVYRVHCPATGNTWAVKCFTREVPGLRDRYRQISDHLQQVRLPFMVDFRYLDEGVRCGGQWYPILKMRWVEGLTLNQFVGDYLQQPKALGQLLPLWVKLAGRLRDARLAHGDLQHGNVLLVPVAETGQLGLRLIDYDGMYVPSLAGTRSGELGHPAYQHPQRARDGIYSGEVDRFSHLVIYTAVQCLLAHPRELWSRFNNDDNLLFRATDFDRPEASPLFRALWAAGDEQARTMVGRLALACRQPLAEVPWLDEVVDDGHASALSPTEQREVDALLTAKRASSAVPPLPRAAGGTTEEGPGETAVPSLPPGEGRGEGALPPDVAQSPLVPSPWIDEARVAMRAAIARAPAAEGTAKEAAGDVPGKPRFGRALVLGAILTVAALLIATVIAMNAQHRRALAEIEANQRRKAATEHAQEAAIAQQEADRKRAEQEAARKQAADLAAQREAERRRVEEETARKAAEFAGAQAAARKKAEQEAAEKRLPKEVAVVLGSGVTLELVLIPAGSFMMGDDKGRDDEKPVHRVNVTRPFYLGKYEVAQREWEAVMGNNPSKFKGLKNPVEGVSWDDCQDFLRKLNAKSNGREGKFVLPTEAQWEYACRAGSTTQYCCGDAETQLDEYAWYKDNSRGKTHAVGKKRPNAWGLHDMHGNAWEWCADWYDKSYYAGSPKDDPMGPEEGSNRVLRGGGWFNFAGFCRSAFRDWYTPGNRHLHLGFRVALIPGASLRTSTPVSLGPEPRPARKDARPDSVITNSVGMTLVLIPAGEFLMGSPGSETDRNPNEGPQHRVRITRPFYLAKYEVKQEEYEQVIGRNPSFHSRAGKGSDIVRTLDTSRLPVEQVSWADAVEFCRRLGQKEGQTYRLPTEAEWEYACRAGTTTPFSCGTVLDRRDANYLGAEPRGTSVRGKDAGRTTRVGSYGQNPFGLHDMHGNVLEWCADWYHPTYYVDSPKDDPAGPGSGSRRVVRGGCWITLPGVCRSASRDGAPPNDRFSFLGFRVVQVLKD